MKRSTGKAASVPAGLFLSLGVNIIITTFVTAIITVLLSRKNITWNDAGYWIMGMLISSSFFGGKVAISSIKTQRYLIAFMSGLLYWMFLMCITALFFGGDYNSFFETGALIISGSLSAALLQSPKKRNFTRKRRPSYC